MNKKAIKIISVLLIVMTILSISITSFAAVNFASMKDRVETRATTTSDNEAIGNVGGSIVGILQAIGIVVSIAVLIVLGIKYMLGSAEEKAEYKKTMLPYVIGAVLIFAASALAGVIANFAGTISTGTK